MTATLAPETARLTRLAEVDLDRLMRLIEQGRVQADEALHDLLPALVVEYGAIGAAAAADWYDERREAVGAKGRFFAEPLEAGDRGAHSLVGWALKEATDDAGLRSLLSGGVQRAVADHMRETVTINSIRDTAAGGWQRVGNGACDFCRMLISRGAVYGEGTADFASHNNCHCSAVPAWGGEPVAVKAYTPSAARSTPRSRAAVRRWMQNNL